MSLCLDSAAAVGSKSIVAELTSTFQQCNRDAHSASEDLKLKIEAQEESNDQLEKEIALIQAELSLLEAHYTAETREVSCWPLPQGGFRADLCIAGY